SVPRNTVRPWPRMPARISLTLMVCSVAGAKPAVPSSSETTPKTMSTRAVAPLFTCIEPSLARMRRAQREGARVQPDWLLRHRVVRGDAVELGRCEPARQLLDAQRLEHAVDRAGCARCGP